MSFLSPVRPVRSLLATSSAIAFSSFDFPAIKLSSNFPVLNVFFRWSETIAFPKMHLMKRTPCIAAVFANLEFVGPDHFLPVIRHWGPRRDIAASQPFSDQDNALLELRGHSLFLSRLFWYACFLQRNCERLLKRSSLWRTRRRFF